MGNAINWLSCNNTLIQGGELTFWIPKSLARNWYHQRGSGKVYADKAIEVLSILKFRFNLTLRGTQGFVKSVVRRLRLNLAVPSYSMLCRSLEKLPRKLRQEPRDRSYNNVHVIVDSTGLKVYGEGD